MSHFTSLLLFDTLGKLDAVTWSAQKPTLLNWGCGGVALVGVLVQVGVARRLRRKNRLDGRDEERFESKKGRRAARASTPPRCWLKTVPC